MTIPPTIPFQPQAMEPKTLDVPVEDDVLETDAPEQGSQRTDFTPEQRKILGEYCARVFSEGEVVRDADREHVWERNRNDYANKAIPYISQFNPAAQDIPMNIASTKADALRDMVTGALFGTRPFVTANIQGVGAEEVYKLELIMQAILEAASVEERVKESAEDAWCTNHAIFRVCWNPETQSYEIDTIDPECFVVAGGDRFGIEASALVGHSYYEREADVLYNIELKKYFDYEQEVEEPESDPLREIRLAQLFVKFDPDILMKDDRVRPVKHWHLLTLDIDKKHVLKIERHTLSDRPWYFSPSYMPSKKKGVFWSKHSLGAFMQGPHVAYQIATNTALMGSVASAFKPVYVQGETTDQATQPQWGSQTVTYGGNVNSPSQTFDPSNLDLLQSRIERVSDGVARVSQVSAGQTFNKGMTATEAQLISQATDQGISGYVSTYSIAFEEMVRYIFKTLRFTYKEVLQGLDSTLIPEDPPALFWRDDIRWTATGRGQFASPGVRMAQLDKVQQMSMNPTLVGKWNQVEIAQSMLDLMGLPNQDRIFDRNAPLPPPPTGIPLGAAPDSGGPPGVQEPANPGGSGGNPPNPGQMPFA